MNAPPLLLENYFFTKLAIDATPARPDPAGAGEIDYTVSTLVGTNTQDPQKWRVIIDVTANPKENTQAPYELSHQVVGFFSVGAGVPEEVREPMVRNNGASILYSAVREFLLTTTGRSRGAASACPPGGSPRSGTRHLTRKAERPSIPRRQGCTIRSAMDFPPAPM